MRIATAAQMAEIDRETIAGGVPGLALMENAGREMTWQLLREFPELSPPALITVVCGKGNNGGDGLVVARLLETLGFEVHVMLLAEPDSLSPDAAANLARLPDSVVRETVPSDGWAERAREHCVESELIVDAVLGTGIVPPLRGTYAELFAALHEGSCAILSLDMPSGVSGDDGAVDPVAVRADATITVGLPKLGLLLPPGRDHAGRLSVVDIGFDVEACERHTNDLHYLLPADYADLLPPRDSAAHKYDAGTTLVVAGSRRFGGAALLAGLGALRSGAGLVTLALPENHATAALGFLPEALIRPLPTGAGGAIAPVAPATWTDLTARQDALAVGPGLGDDPETDAWLVDLLGGVPGPLVVDADGLSAYWRLGREPRFAHGEVVLTPHGGELARLAGDAAGRLRDDRLGFVPDLARRWNVVLVAKGSPTLIAAPDGTLVINPTGDDALAHGGTGDVLTGLIGGLLAQGAPAFAAALLGCWLHGRAGELAATDTGSRRTLLAREIADHLGEAYRELEVGP